MIFVGEKAKGRAGLFLVTLALLAFSGITEVNAEEGLVLHLSFDREGSRVNDLSGKGNNGILMGNPKWVKGRLGKALLFDGKDDYINCGDDGSLSVSKAISIECWVRLCKFEGRQDLVYRPHIYSINWLGDRSLFQWALTSEAGLTILHSQKRDWATGRWYHLVATYDSSLSNNQLKLYIDGSIDKAMEATGLIKPTGLSLSLAIGVGGYPYCGLLDEMRMYNRALSAQEVKDHYQMLSPGLPGAKVNLHLFQIDEKGVMLSFPVNQLEEELSKLSLKLIISDKGGEVLSEEEINKITSKDFLYENEIDISALPKGEFVLRAELRKGKETLTESSLPFSKSGVVRIEAESFSQGNVVATLSGHMGDSLVIRHGSAKGSDFVEYSLDLAVPIEKGELLIKYAAEEPRPVDIYLDGKIVVKDGLKSSTGSWWQSEAQWEEQGILKIPAGKHILKLVGKPHIPVIDAIKLCPAE